MIKADSPNIKWPKTPTKKDKEIHNKKYVFNKKPISVRMEPYTLYDP
jgi:hypothetical protein